MTLPRFETGARLCGFGGSRNNGIDGGAAHHQEGGTMNDHRAEWMAVLVLFLGCVAAMVIAALVIRWFVAFSGGW